MNLTKLSVVCGLAALAFGCASTDPIAATAPDPILNPLGVPEVAPENAESLLPADLAAERTAVESRAFAMPANYDLGGADRTVLGTDPDACVTTSAGPVEETAVLNNAIRSELERLTVSSIREISMDNPGLCTHVMEWKADLAKAQEGYACNVNVALYDVSAKTAVSKEAFTAKVTVPAAANGVPVQALRRLGTQVALKIADIAIGTLPFSGKVIACEDLDLLVMEGGSLQGIYEGQQMLIYAVIDGAALPLAYADAKPGTTRTNLTPWKLNEADALAKTVLEALDDDPEAFTKYGLRAIAVGEALSPLQRRRLAQ